MRIYEDLTELIGNTPLLLLRSFSQHAQIIGKLEFLNPGGSSKDRVAKRLIEEAKREGRLQGKHLVEKSGGNTAISLCWIAARNGFRADVVVPDNIGETPVELCKYLGAEVHPTPATQIVDRWRDLAGRFPDSCLLDQFASPHNVEAHRTSTGPEIWDDTSGKVDAVIAGIGTGGTLAGVSRYLKGRNANCRIIGVEPSEAPVLSAGRFQPHCIHGLGLPNPPVLLQRSDLDEIILVSSDEAVAMGKMLAQREGILAGPSSGAVLQAAVLYSSRPENAGKLIVVIMGDGLRGYAQLRGR